MFLKTDLHQMDHLCFVAWTSCFRYCSLWFVAALDYSGRRKRYWILGKWNGHLWCLHLRRQLWAGPTLQHSHHPRCTYPIGRCSCLLLLLLHLLLYLQRINRPLICAKFPNLAVVDLHLLLPWSDLHLWANVHQNQGGLFWMVLREIGSKRYWGFSIEIKINSVNFEYSQIDKVIREKMRLMSKIWNKVYLSKY